MYLADMLRHEAEAQCIEAPDEFLASLNMEVTISLAQKDDLKRAEELTERTHQFNTTGHAYTYEELEMFRVSSDHQLLLVALSDRYASYGIVGLALVECRPDAWTLKSFFVSCRVLSRGIASVLLCHLRNEAARKKVRLLAELVPNDANLVTSIVYKFAGFRVIDQQHGLMVFEDTQPGLQPFPHHMQVGINV
jgi:FkbH-like protein